MTTTTDRYWDVSWNPIVGCSHASPGCDHCWAERLASTRLAHLPEYDGIVRDGRWTGTARFLRERLSAPLRWRKPKVVFACLMSDLFLPLMSDVEIATIFAVMAVAPAQRFLVCTKRPALAQAWFQWLEAQADRCRTMFPLDPTDWRRWHVLRAAALRQGCALPQPATSRSWPARNIWLGVTVEDVTRAAERIPALQRIPAYHRWLSLEPLLGPIPDLDLRGIDWVVVGAENGPGARPCDPAWIADIVEQCRRAGVPCWHKTKRTPLVQQMPAELQRVFRGGGGGCS
jgi:protein gp37